MVLINRPSRPVDLPSPPLTRFHPPPPTPRPSPRCSLAAPLIDHLLAFHLHNLDLSAAKMFVRTTLVTLACAAVALATHVALPLHRRTGGGQIPISCNDIPPETAPCTCPQDLNKDSGVLINWFPGYQCAYPGGACTWSNTVGLLGLSRLD